MKTLIYITKERFWLNDKEFLVGESLEKSLVEVVSDQSLGEVRIVLGDEVSYTIGFKLNSILEKREEISRVSQSLIPVILDTNNFDWRKKVLKNKEVWIQAVAVERSVLEEISKWVIKQKQDVTMVEPISTILAEKFGGEEVQLLTYEGKEKLVVVVAGGVAESVFGSFQIQEAMTYVKSKWKVEKIQEKSVSDSDFSLSDFVFGERVRGSDADVLSIPILKTIDLKVQPLVKSAIGTIVSVPKEKPKKIVNWRFIGVIGVLLVCFAIFSYLLLGNKNKVEKRTAEISPTVTQTPTATPTPVVLDLKGYRVQILNGSGETGLAGGIKELLVGEGFVEVETGNAPRISETVVKAKINVSDAVLSVVLDKIKDYEIGEKVALTSDSKYDLVIVVGSVKK